jgi:DNA-binding CsgD family transcriptional regulator
VGALRVIGAVAPIACGDYRFGGRHRPPNRLHIMAEVHDAHRRRDLVAARDRRDRTYDPELADLFVEHGASWFEQLDKQDPWDAVLDLEPEPHRTLVGAELDEAITVAADFIDLKSPYMAGHSRRCAQLAADAAELLGCTDAEITSVRRAALLHEFGTTAIPNSILDKRGPLTRAEFDRVEHHPMFTEQMLMAAGHGNQRTARPRPQLPGGLTRREVEVLHLAALGLTTQQLADRLFISPKTADHHIQHVYTKIGVSTRAAAALWAMQNDVVQ